MLLMYAMENYLAKRMNEILPSVTTWMDRECHAKLNKSDRKR